MSANQLKKRCFSFSLLSRADNEHDFLNYVFCVKEDSVPMAVGRIIHEGVYSDELSELKRVAVHCDGDYLTDDNKVVLNTNTASNAVLMSHLVRKSRSLQSIVDGAIYEKAMVIMFRSAGVCVMFKGIFDLINFARKEAVEIKTTFSNKMNLRKKIDQYHYDMQAYCLRLVASKVASMLNIKFLFIRKIFPFDIIDLDVSNDILASGRKKFMCYFLKSVDIIKRNRLEGMFFL